MLHQRMKLKPLNQRAKLPREYDYRLNQLNQRMTIKIRSPIQEINTIGRFGDSINQLDKLRIEKEHLQNVVPVVRNLSVWERLSKAKHSLNSLGEVIGNPYRHERCLKTGPAVRTFKQYQPAKRLLEKSVIKPGTTQVVNTCKEPVKVIAKKCVKTNVDNKCLNKSITQLELKKSKTSAGDVTPKNSNIIASPNESSDWCEINISDDDSEEAYESAMQIKDSEESVTFSARIALDFRAALEKRSCTMDPEEISVVKNIVKMDKRLQNVRSFKEDDFRNVLRSKLRKISKQETILKNALRNLGNDPQGIQQLQDLMSVNNKPQVHVILNNVPNMHREAVILRALGEKLEEVLTNCSQKPYCAAHQETKRLHRVYHTLGPSHFALGYVRVQGVCVHIAFVREFCIAKKTINELKNEKRQFYLPANEQLTELRRTSFKRLREDPQLLLSYLQPKDSLVPFNVLEQDSFFFTSFLHKSFRSVSSSEDFSDEEETVVICEPNDSNKIHKKESLKIEEIDATTHRKLKPMRNEVNVGDTFTHMENSGTESKFKLCDQVISDLPSQSQGDVFSTKPATTKLQTNKSQVAPIRGTKRRRVRKHITPLPERNYVNPKNRIVTYVLVGVVEVSLLLAIIMSFWYPDIVCSDAENLGRRK